MTNRSGAFTLTLTLMFLFFSLNGTCGGTGEDKSAWPAWRGPNGDGISREANWDPGFLAVGPELLWRAKIGAGYSNVSINNDRLYTAGKSLRHVIYCLDAWTGEEIWRYEGGVNEEVQGTPTVDGRSVYSLFYNGDLLIITSNTAGLAVDKNTGERIWGSERPPGKVCEVVETLYTAFANGTDYSAPVVYKYGGIHRALISSWAGMHSVDAETGVVNWLFPWKIYSGGQVADPLCFDQMIFISGNVSLGSILLDISSGQPEVLWRNENLCADTSTAVMIDGYLYGCAGGPEARHCFLRCVDVRTGEIAWEQDFGRMQLTVLGAGNKVIIMEDIGMLRIAEATPDAYVEVSSCQLPAERGHKNGGPRRFCTRASCTAETTTAICCVSM